MDTTGQAGLIPAPPTDAQELALRGCAAIGEFRVDNLRVEGSGDSIHTDYRLALMDAWLPGTPAEIVWRQNCGSLCGGDWCRGTPCSRELVAGDTQVMFFASSEYMLSGSLLAGFREGNGGVEEILGRLRPHDGDRLIQTLEEFRAVVVRELGSAGIESVEDCPTGAE